MPKVLKKDKHFVRAESYSKSYNKDISTLKKLIKDKKIADNKGKVDGSADSVGSVEGSEDSTKSDGMSLEMGGRSFNERQMDRQGLNRFEKQDVYQGKFEDNELEALDEKLAEFHADREREKKLFAQNFEGSSLGARRRKVTHEAIKLEAAEKFLGEARDLARQTADKKDDKYVNGRLMSDMNKQVYDEGETVDDFVPGAKFLKKYGA